MNKIIIEVSIGELLDKISILEIKQGKIKDPEKLKFINKEHSILKDQFEKNVKSDDKLNNLSKDLNSILEFVDQLKEIKTDQVDPTSNSLNQKLEVRDDKVDTKNSAEDILENAPEKEMDFFVVPKVIE